MSKLTKKEVEHVARLANLKLDPQEKGRLEKQLSEVISFVEKLKEVNTQELEPTSQTTGLKNIFRIDKTQTANCLISQEALSGTEKTHNGYFVVPGILTERSDK